jgi:hypothetical protein
MTKKLLILSLAILMLPSLVFGATIFSDNFNSYIDGNLDDQGGWTLLSGNEGGGQVQGITKYEGLKAVWFNNNATIYKKIGDPIDNGAIEVWVRVESITAGQVSYISLYNNGGSQVVYCPINLDIGGSIQCFDMNTSSWVLIGSITAGTWTNFQIEWRTIDDNFKAKVGSENWSNWLLGIAEFTTIQQLSIGSGTYGSDVWFDTISDITPPPTKYTCNEEYQCVEDPEGEFETLEECEVACVMPAVGIFSITSNDITTMWSFVSNLFSDAKLLILLALGVPLAFYVIKKAIGLAPRR